MKQQLKSHLNLFYITEQFILQVWPYGSSPHNNINVCPNETLIGNGICDTVNLNVLCQFDGLDCCNNSAAIDDGMCNQENLNQNCNYDGKDCRDCVKWKGYHPPYYYQSRGYEDESCATIIRNSWIGYCD